jgi:hypothetical protein
MDQGPAVEPRNVVSLADFRRRTAPDSEHPPPSPKPAAARRPAPPRNVDAIGWIGAPRPHVFAA